MLLECRNHIRREWDRRSLTTCASEVEKILRQQRDVGRAIPKRRDRQHGPAQADVQVLAEAACVDLGLEIAVGCRDDSDVQDAIGHRADASIRLAVEDAEESSLELERQLTDLIEQDGSAVGRLEQSLIGPCGARECSTLVISR